MASPESVPDSFVRRSFISAVKSMTFDGPSRFAVAPVTSRESCIGPLTAKVPSTRGQRQPHEFLPAQVSVETAIPDLPVAAPVDPHGQRLGSGPTAR